MKKRIIFPLTLFFMIIMITPVFAAVQLDVNDRIYDTSGQADVKDGITSAAINVLADTLGCTVTIEGDSITMQENQDSLRMTIGSTTAFFNGQEKQMPRAPQRLENQVYLPVRFIYESFGAVVDWKGIEKLVSVSYPETRNDMTAEELLTKTSQKMLEANRYKMSVTSKNDIDMLVQANGKDPENMKMQQDSLITGWVQADPMLMYMKQDATVNTNDGSGGTNPQSIQTEILFNNSGMYMTMPKVGWVKMNLPGMNIQELIKQSMNQDLSATMKQMKELGMSISFANDREMNGHKYWIIDTTMGGDLFKSDYFKQLIKACGLSQTPDMEKSLSDMQASFSYSTWINQETFYTDFMDLQGKMKVAINVPNQDKPGKMTMDMNIQANYNISDYGVTFQIPDVSKAADYEQVLKSQQ